MVQEPVAQDPAQEPTRNSGKLRKVSVAVAGGTVTLVGIVLLPLPGPGTVIILGGLAILGSEFPIARRPIDKLKQIARQNRAR